MAESAPISLDLDRHGDYARVSIVPPAGETRPPLDICCVVDTSGSMSSSAAITTNAGTEGQGLTVLDIVKHAVKTVIQSLGAEDRLALVAFSSGSTRDLVLTNMDEEGKAKATTAIEAMRTGGGTIMWGGIKNGLDLIREGKIAGKNASVFLFTDGEPTDKGHVDAYKEYKNTHKDLDCSLNTFGFGYSLDSPLLEELAIEGLGTYAFIPDSSFVGTVFVNTVSDLMVTAATNVTLTLSPASAIVSLLGNPVSKDCESSKVISVGSVKFGQSRDFVIQLNADASPLTVTLNYTDTSKRAKAEPITETGSSSDANPDLLLVHRFRLQFVQKVRQAMNQMKIGLADKAQKIISEFISEVKSSNVADDERVVGLLADLEGQVTEAFSKMEYYNKWGKHYLLSLARAHLMQFCNNFKDPGVQLYGGDLFRAQQDVIDEIFLQLPPPTPSVTYSAYGNYGGGGAAAATTYSAPVDMSNYYCASNA